MRVKGQEKTFHVNSNSKKAEVTTLPEKKKQNLRQNLLETKE